MYLCRRKLHTYPIRRKHPTYQYKRKGQQVRIIIIIMIIIIIIIIIIIKTLIQNIPYPYFHMQCERRALYNKLATHNE